MLIQGRIFMAFSIFACIDLDSILWCLQIIQILGWNQTGSVVRGSLCKDMAPENSTSRKTSLNHHGLLVLATPISYVLHFSRVWGLLNHKWSSIRQRNKILISGRKRQNDLYDHLKGDEISSKQAFSVDILLMEESPAPIELSLVVYPSLHLVLYVPCGG